MIGKNSDDIDSLYEWHSRNKLKEGQKLLYTEENKSCTFVEYDECVGMMVVKFEQAFKSRGFLGVNSDTYERSVNFESIKIVGKLKK